jgi:GMP synthase (glutamine-hydrolysing)
MVHLGNFESVLREHGFDIDIIDGAAPALALADALAEAADAELLIVLGSSAGVYEANRHAFIAPELDHVRARLAAERPTLGVCFGAQLIAAALGSDVRPGGTVDVGYREVTPTAAGLSSPLRHVSGVRMAEWHGDTFDLPEGCTLLASSAAYENEAYGIGDWLLAVQFHPELTDEMHEEWLSSGIDYVERNGYTPHTLRAQRAHYGAPMQRASQHMLAAYLESLPE